MNKFVRIAVSVLLLSFLAYKTDWPHVGQAFAHLRWGYWLSAVLLLAVTQVVSARRWQLLAGALGIAVRRSRIASYFFIGMFFNLVLPTSVGGDVVRAYYLTGRSGHKLPAFVSVLSDRINGFYVLLALACTTVTLQAYQLPWWIVAAVWGTSLCFCVGMAMLPWLASWGKRGPLRAEKVRAMFRLLRQPRLLAADDPALPVYSGQQHHFGLSGWLGFGLAESDSVQLLLGARADGVGADAAADQRQRHGRA